VSSENLATIMTALAFGVILTTVMEDGCYIVHAEGGHDIHTVIGANGDSLDTVQAAACDIWLATQH
jgi:hypothetical protein